MTPTNMIIEQQLDAVVRAGLFRDRDHAVRARNYSREHAIPCLDRPTCLRALWLRKVIAKKDVKKLLRQIEAEQGMVIMNKERIFE